MKKRNLCLILAAVLTCSQALTVSAATRKEKLMNEKAATQSQLAVQEKKIGTLEEQKKALTAEIDELDQELVNLLVEIGILEEELENKEAEIEKTQKELVVAQQDRDEQYDAMKKRIQYLYENGGGDAWAQLLLAGEDLSSVLNRAEYIQKLYDSDRKALDSFKEVVQQVENLQNRLETEKADLEVLQVEYENQKVNLETQMEQKKAASADYESQIQTAKVQAEEFTELIYKQNAEICKIEEEEKKIAEEKARKAAEEKARKEVKKKQETEKNTNTNNINKKEENNANQKQPSSNNTNEEESTSKVPYNPTGQSVVAYATQFVGNPYVFGGTSLTNGTDCSGFTQGVYAHFGISLPRTSAAQRSVGRAVSYADAMPGDLICYAGHVAIYMGGGAIVHASNQRDGIKISPNAAYRPILAVRRVL